MSAHTAFSAIATVSVCYALAIRRRAHVSRVIATARQRGTVSFGAYPKRTWSPRLCDSRFWHCYVRRPSTSFWSLDRLRAIRFRLENLIDVNLFTSDLVRLVYWTSYVESRNVIIHYAIVIVVRQSRRHIRRCIIAWVK